MITPSDFKKLVLLERQIEESNQRLNALLDTEALLIRGDILRGFLSNTPEQNLLRFNCSNNFSRFREGDTVELSSDSAQFVATVKEIKGNGRLIDLDIRNVKIGVLSGEWLLKETGTDLSNVILSALGKLRPGSPGWFFFQTLNGEVEPYCTEKKVISKKKMLELLSDLSAESKRNLDLSQKEIFFECLKTPTSFSVQGPPGTGKTLVLAFAAEALARLGKRVVILAPTHQAVNNALSTIHNSFPERKLLKIGDELRRESLSEEIPTSLLRRTEKLTGDEFNGDTIIGMTFLSGIYNLVLRNSSFAPNVVFLEEAGQLPLTQGICTGLIGAGSILMFGDDRQMSPVFPMDVAEEPLAKSLFEAFREVQPQYVKMLMTSYRLNKELCSIIGNAFYSDTPDAKLQSGEKACNRRFNHRAREKISNKNVAKTLSPESSFVWVKSKERSSKSLNQREAEFTAEILTECLKGGLTAQEIAAVTPFRRQAARIRHLLESQIPYLEDYPIIDTVERVQGLTVELVILSVCASDPEYIASVSEFLLSPNRLNVSLSRAKTKAILVASDAILKVVPANYGAFLSQIKWKTLLDQATAIEVID